MKSQYKKEGFENQFLFVLPDNFRSIYQVDPLFFHFCITDIGLFPNAQYHFRKRKTGSESAILLICTKGEGYYILSDGKKELLHAGQAVVIPPRIPHEYGASENAPWSIFWMHMQGSLIPAYNDTLRERFPLSIDAHQIENIARLFYDCFHILKQPIQKEAYFALCQIGTNILGALLLAGKHTEYPMTFKGKQAIQTALLYMKEHIKDTITLADVAVASNFSASHLNELFKKSTGNSPLEYFQHMKIYAASKPLYFSDRLIKDIAIEYGIYDPYYFSRIFKKIMGVSPQQYRNLNKG